MTSVTLHFRDETEQMLRENATRRGQTLEAYLEQLAEREADANVPATEPWRQLTDNEFDRLLDELSAGPGPRLSHLPVDSLPASIIYRSSRLMLIVSPLDSQWPESSDPQLQTVRRRSGRFDPGGGGASILRGSGTSARPPRP